MENTDKIRKELSVLLAHYLRERYPDIYKEFEALLNQNRILPEGCNSIQEALEIRYKNFPNDQFYKLVQSLRPSDDFPSIFRRINPFTFEKPSIPFGILNSVKHIFCHDAAIFCLAIDPLGRILVTGSDDFSLKLWTIPDLIPIIRFSGHTGVISQVCFNPLSTLLLSTSHDQSIRLWSLETGKCQAVLRGFTNDAVHYAVFSPSGSLIAAGCEDKRIQIWVTSDALLSKPPCRTIFSHGNGAITWLAFSPGGEFLVYSSEPNTLMVISLKTMSQHLLEFHMSPINLVMFTNKFFPCNGMLSPHVISVSNDEGIAAVWGIDQTNWSIIHKFKNGTQHGRKFSKILVSALDCDEHLLVLVKNGCAYICDTISGNTVGEITDATAFIGCTCIAANPVYPQIFFFGNCNGDVAIADVQNLTILNQNKIGGEPEFLDAIWSTNGEWIFASDNSGCITSFHCLRKDDPLSQNDPDYEISEIYDISEFINTTEHYYCNKRGERLPNQPPPIDLRNLHLPILLAQTPFIRNTSMELNLIEKMNTADRQPSTSQSTIIGPPPLHIHLSVECPVNPHLESNDTSIEATSNEEEEHNENIAILSDQDEWNFQEISELETDTEESYCSYLFSNDIPRGYFKDYLTIIGTTDYVYIPQVGDEVVFIKNAYQKIFKDFNAYPGVDFIRTKIVSIDINPNVNGFVITFLENVQILYFIPEKVSYLVLLAKFSTTMNQINSINVGDTVIVPISNDNNYSIITLYKGEITNKNNNSFESISIDFGKFKLNVSPWQIYSVNNRQIFNYESIISAKMKRVMNNMLSVMQKFSSDYRYDFMRKLPLLNNINEIKFPMTLNLFAERLENEYYRSAEAIEKDIDLVLENVSICNQNTIMNSKAEDLCANLKNNLDLLMKQIK
ncbi:tetratricopeptide repeat protein [Histomonas meleagridis]|uniref:tetratricopeptide repeat protein n=1 Tax=Histomonas meleagridis TaxID=135588 RepID=UPI00355A58E2|nr:tetratricopeptide repeat protein [Histomonas meleagridis]KAH0801389.1 tetratricopeptide repeat protein [Histomonas meleagridis]